MIKPADSGSNIFTLDLSRYGQRVFMGRPKGKNIRKKARLDEVDSTSRKVRVLIPANTVTMGSSFFLGLLGESIRKCGSKNRFLEKFSFEGPEFIRTVVVDNNIDRALFEGGSVLPDPGSDEGGS